VTGLVAWRVNINIENDIDMDIESVLSSLSSEFGCASMLCTFESESDSRLSVCLSVCLSALSVNQTSTHSSFKQWSNEYRLLSLLKWKSSNWHQFFINFPKKQKELLIHLSSGFFLLFRRKHYSRHFLEWGNVYQTLSLFIFWYMEYELFVVCIKKGLGVVVSVCVIILLYSLVISKCYPMMHQSVSYDHNTFSETQRDNSSKP